MDKKFKRIYDLRVDNDITQRQMANILNTTRDTYAQWERGFCNFPLKEINTFANYFNISLDYITGLTNIKENYACKNPNLKAIPIKIKKMRILHKYSQEELCAMINLKQRTYSGYETGRSKTPLYVLYLLAKTYNVSLDYLIGRKKDRHLQNKEADLLVK